MRLHSFLGREAQRIDAADALFGGRAHLVLLVLLVLAGAGLRTVALDNPHYRFHATRQYRAALIARAQYYSLRPPAEPSRQRVAQHAAAQRGMLELPLTEALTAAGYVLAGGETPVVPRLLTSAFWLLAGGCLYLLARLLFTPDAALAALAYHVLTPYGVVAGRSFQPESLLVLTTAIALLALVRHHLAPQPRSGLVAGLTAALAVAVKPVALFFVALPFAMLALQRQGLRRALSSKSSWIFVLCLCVPVAFYAWHALTAGRLAGQAATSFQPELLTTPGFWLGWRRMIETVHGEAILALGLLGAVFAPRGMARVLVIALWLAYGVYGLVFSYHISTHDYYQVPAIPVLALSLASLAAALLRIVPRRAAAFGRAVGVASFVALAYWGSTRSAPVLTARADATIELYREIGEAVGHSDKVIFLSPNSWGAPIQFYAEIAGWYWYSVRQNYQRKRPPERWQNRATLEALVREHGARYFVADDVKELRKQRWLADYLRDNCRLAARSRSYIIYDLQSGPSELPRAPAQ